MAVEVLRKAQAEQSTWRRIDVAHECYQQGYSIEEIAQAADRCTATIEKWLEVAMTFPAVIRSDEISPTTYMYLCHFPDPWEAAEFVLRHELSNLQVVYLYNAMRDYQKGERYFRSGVPFSLEEMAYRAKILPRPERLTSLAALKAENQELRRKLNNSEKIRAMYLKALGRKAGHLRR